MDISEVVRAERLFLRLSEEEQKQLLTKLVTNGSITDEDEDENAASEVSEKSSSVTLSPSTSSSSPNKSSDSEVITLDDSEDDDECNLVVNQFSNLPNSNLSPNPSSPEEDKRASSTSTKKSFKREEPSENETTKQHHDSTSALKESGFSTPRFNLATIGNRKRQQHDDDDVYRKLCQRYKAMGYIDSDSESESEGDSNWSDAIILSDDDDNDDDEVDEEMTCFRCPSRRVGKFQDVEKFRIHSKRHKYGEVFLCVTCERSFTRLNYCLSHEIRVHGTAINYDDNDPVISYAKKYAREKQDYRAKRAAAKEQNGESSSTAAAATATHETDTSSDETDCEDPKFYDGQIIPSNTFCRYRGPPVLHKVESYEIHLNHAPPKFRTPSTNCISKLALGVYELNVQRNAVTHAIGRFSKKAIDGENGDGENGESSKSPGKSDSAEKRGLSDGSDGEQQRPQNMKKKKKVHYRIMTSSESSENTSDTDYEPFNKRPRVSEDKSTDQPSETAPSSETQKKRQVTELTRQLLPALINRKCQKCSYYWKSDKDLRSHRDSVHPNLCLAELLPIVEIKQNVIVKSKIHKPQPVEPARPNISIEAPIATKDSPPKVKQNGAIKRAGSGKRRRKSKSPSLAVYPRRPTFPTPVSTYGRPTFPTLDSTYGEKEKYLYHLGLINVVRLEVFRNKGKDVKLPECYIRLEKADGPQIRNG